MVQTNFIRLNSQMLLNADDVSLCITVRSGPGKALRKAVSGLPTFFNFSGKNKGNAMIITKSGMYFLTPFTVKYVEKRIGDSLDLLSITDLTHREKAGMTLPAIQRHLDATRKREEAANIEAEDDAEELDPDKADWIEPVED